MAKNKSYEFLNQVTLPVNSGTVSGDPVLVNELAGIALRDRDNDGNSEVKIKGGPVFSLSVQAINASGNSAVAKGDKLYYVSANTPKLSKTATGTFFGYAYGTIDAGSTTTIDVILA